VPMIMAIEVAQQRPNAINRLIDDGGASDFDHLARISSLFHYRNISFKLLKAA
jgi:hypothetical protein